MQSLLTILFAFSLIGLVTTDRVRGLTRLLWVQGLLLAGIAGLELSHHFTPEHLVLVLLETLGVKVIVTPWLIGYILRKGDYKGAARPTLPPLAMMGITMGVLLALFLGMQTMGGDALSSKTLAAAFAAMFVGLLLVVTHRQMVVHLIGFFVLENGVFLLSLSAGSELPLLVTGAVLFDLVSTSLGLGLLATKVSLFIHGQDVEHLSNLKD